MHMRIGVKNSVFFFSQSVSKKPSTKQMVSEYLNTAYVTVVEVIQFIFRNISLYVGLAPTRNICNT